MTHIRLALVALLGTACAHSNRKPPAPDAAEASISHAVDGTVKVSNPFHGSGAGFAWDAHTVVTARHVVAGAMLPPVVETRQGETCKTLGTFTTDAADVALVFVADCELTPIPRAPADPEQGDEVWAIGHPFGFEWSISRGAIASVRPGMRFAGLPPTTYLQVDAAINPGNSGGPLVDAHGRLVGLAMGLYSHTGAFAGLGFGLPLSVLTEAAQAFEDLPE